jgi:phenylacetate-CoA ligase
MILLFYPVVKAPGLTFTTLQKHYRGRWKCKRIYDQIKTDTFIIKYVSDIILSQSKKKIEEAIALYLEPNLKFSYINILKETSEAN